MTANPQLPTAEELKEKAAKSPYKGASCTFIKVDKDWGLKVYRDKSTRDHCFRLQSIFAEHYCAPPVGEKIDIGNKFCYTTRVAEVFLESEIDDSMIWYEAEEDLCERFDVPERRAEIERTVGIELRDVHVGNWGVYNGQLVYIDFDCIWD